MKIKTAQRFLIASGILVLLGGGSCLIATDKDIDGLDQAILFGFSGLGALGIAVILGIIGLIGLIIRRREPTQADLEKK
jgi:hypothetical protein